MNKTQYMNLFDLFAVQDAWKGWRTTKKTKVFAWCRLRTCGVGNRVVVWMGPDGVGKHKRIECVHVGIVLSVEKKKIKSMVVHQWVLYKPAAVKHSSQPFHMYDFPTPPGMRFLAVPCLTTKGFMWSDNGGDLHATPGLTPKETDEENRHQLVLFR